MRSISRSSDRARALRGVGAIVGLSLAVGAATGVAQGQSVVCWGKNSDGQRDVPANLGPCSAIAGGALHTIALRTDGLLRCWGNNDYGQCDVPADLGFVARFAGGSYHTVVLRTEGDVRCWGINNAGQCDAPADLGSCAAVACGGEHTVALRTDGVVRCWGLNVFGQCNVPASLGACSAIAGGWGHTVALRTDGAVRCWGYNVNGQCTVPASVGACKAIASGGYHTIALRTDGTVRCWGYNANGECNVPANLGACTAIAGGDYHTVALRTDGTVRCWGYNLNGQCTVPAGLGAISAIASFGSHTIALGLPSPEVDVELLAGADSASAGDTITVRVISTAPGTPLSGGQFALRFDATRLRLDGVAPVGTSSMGVEVAEQIDNTAGTLRYALGLTDPAVPLTTDADLCDLTFTVLAGSDLCGAEELVYFSSVGAFSTRFTRFNNTSSVVPALTNLPPINLDSTPPVLTGVPAADIAVATDAGSTFGALVSLPTVTAVDACEGAVSVTVTGAIASGLYPIGTTTVTWSATDSVGNTVSVSRDIVVGNYQLLDARISFNGVLAANAPRSIRVTAGASVGVHPVMVLAGTGGFGMIAGIVVPVATSYPCVSAKDTVHSLTRTAAASIVGSRYEATFALVQGDSNNDDMIEIVDYATWVIDFGSGKAVDARSNFNADALVNNADLGFVSTGFFTVGESCTGAVAGARPRERISVKELRRAGLGELAAADLNRDGWFDMRDMQIAVQGGGGDGGADAQPSAAEGSGVQW
jgi:hypothetical protein